MSSTEENEIKVVEVEAVVEVVAEHVDSLQTEELERDIETLIQSVPTLELENVVPQGESENIEEISVPKEAQTIEIESVGAVVDEFEKLTVFGNKSLDELHKIQSKKSHLSAGNAYYKNQLIFAGFNVL